VTRSEADRRVHDFEADVATLLLVDPITNAHREALL